MHAKTLTSSGGIMECIKILFLVAFLFLVIIAQMADEILLMVCLLLRHQYLRNQVALLMIEYCRWQRHQARWHNPYFRKLPRPKQSWFEIHYNDWKIPWYYFRKQLWMNQCTFDILLNVLLLVITHKNTILHGCVAPEKSSHAWFVLSCSWQLVWKYWASFQCWKVDWSRSSARCCRSPFQSQEWLHKVSIARNIALYRDISRCFLISRTLLLQLMDPISE